ncbi:MAG: hypothetical protein J1E63_03470 [Muribaculaceae bacterium]|nr:hypothetical protein [Muribaculaceae bacterium]
MRGIRVADYSNTRLRILLVAVVNSHVGLMTVPCRGMRELRHTPSSPQCRQASNEGPFSGGPLAWHPGCRHSNTRHSIHRQRARALE